MNLLIKNVVNSLKGNYLDNYAVSFKGEGCIVVFPIDKLGIDPSVIYSFKNSFIKAFLSVN